MFILGKATTRQLAGDTIITDSSDNIILVINVTYFGALHFYSSKDAERYLKDLGITLDEIDLVQTSHSGHKIYWIEA